MDFFDRMMAHVDDVPTFVQGHFHGVEFARLSRLDIAKWCAFVFYTKSYDDTTAIEKKELDAMVAKLYAQANSPTTKDLSDGATFPFLKPNLDPFEATARPMALYMATIGVNYVVSTWLRWQGFHYYYVTSAIRYWHRPPQSSHGEAPPLVFVHGVGIGLSTYVPLLYTLFEHSTDRHVFLMDLPYISMQWSDDEVPDKDQIVSAISVMLAQQQLSGTSVHWVGHSFGTIVMSWVCQERPDLVHYLTFVDPVVFGMWKHDGIYNLMYKPPSTAIDLFLWYFASQEIGIARSLRRHLLWYESALFPANLPRHPHSKHVLASVFLSEKDCIIDAPAAYAHLQRGVHLPGPSHNGTPRVPIHATMWPGFTHGELMMHRSAHADVMSTLSFHTNTTISTTHERKSDSG
ncbi:hypothetical protein H310_05235 [Aphanomyces invadans]|uniref:AB hydrolase-1 domain-containing protein n=1 Tax=Aphanomyces invadans TaxID=157072 RepID=A0A024U8X7_9STRA|nr:hypothetical protein H310_05235 [Aphanomyces invadans]ETW02734.1 hypothetical protein H310_05235 [Aphanomyces invadans]|eukprot:XP_008868118.1 hypothetical protein H310_05235 [Aphanomyces invadans]